MIQYDPTFKLNLSGTDIATYDLNTSFPLSSKKEASYEIPYALTPVQQEVDFSNVTNAKLVLFYSDNAFSIHLVKTVAISESTSYQTDIQIPNPGGIPTVFNTLPEFLEDLDSIYITSDSSVTIVVNASFYGKSDVPTPTISSITPSFGDDGSSVVIQGTGFINVTEITIGS